MGEQTVTRGEGKASCGPVRAVCPQMSRRMGVSCTTRDSQRGNFVLYCCRLQMARRMSKDMSQGGRSPVETCFLLWHKAFPRS